MNSKKALFFGFMVAVIIGVFIGKYFLVTNNQHTRVWFKAFHPVENSEMRWLGCLYREDSETGTSVIVDFKKNVNLAKDDRLEGKYVPTEKTAICNGQPYRVYELNGAYKFVDPLSVK